MNSGGNPSRADSPDPVFGNLVFGDRVFGDRVSLARRFAEILSTVGVERGLLGPRESPRVWDRHLLNCAVVEELIPSGVRVVDVGSGAGLPGLALAIARPDLEVDLVEPLLRRTVFLQEVVDELRLSARVVRGRAEEKTVRTAVGGAPVVVSRAIAPLATLSAWCLPLTRRGGAVLAIKGASARDELERDRAEVVRLGGRDLRVEECGGSRVESTTVVSIRRAR